MANLQQSASGKKEGDIRYLTPLNIETNKTKKYCRFKIMQKLHAIQLDNKKAVEGHENDLNFKELQVLEIGRASCRERV